jgi:hypothetical protein
VASKDKLVNINEWTSARLLLAPSLSGFVLGSSTLTLRFRFDTVDDINNEGTGWHIDDIAVCAVGGIPTLSPPAMVILVLLMATAAFVFLARRRRQARGWPPAAGGTPGLS